MLIFIGPVAGASKRIDETVRYVLENIEAGKLSGEIKRRGISDRQRIRVVLDTLDDDMPLARIAEEGGAFAFLADEPDLYSESDIRPGNVSLRKHCSDALSVYRSLGQ